MGSEKEVDFQGPEVKGEKNNEDQQYQKNDEDRKYRNGDEPVVERRESSSSEREDKDDITDARKKENLKSDIPEPLPPPVVRDGRRYLSIQRYCLHRKKHIFIGPRSDHSLPMSLTD